MRTLLETPIVFIVLIWIISALSKRFKEMKAEAEKQHKAPKWPTMFPETLAGQQEEEKERASGRKRNAYQRGQVPSYNNEPNIPATRETAFIPDYFDHGPAQTIEARYADRGEEFESTDEQRKREIDAERLVDGLIWSEVLGPPRAKRPHRAIKKTNHSN